jgi:hypothetical protein
VLDVNYGKDSGCNTDKCNPQVVLKVVKPFVEKDLIYSVIKKDCELDETVRFNSIFFSSLHFFCFSFFFFRARSIRPRCTAAYRLKCAALNSPPPLFETFLLPPPGASTSIRRERS